MAAGDACPEVCRRHEGAGATLWSIGGAFRGAGWGSRGGGWPASPAGVRGCQLRIHYKNGRVQQMYILSDQKFIRL